MRTVDTERRAAAHDAVASDAARPDRPGSAGPTGLTSPVAAPRPGVELSAQGRAERSTRARVARLILELGPSTASVIGGRLGLTPAAIRRHLDNLLTEGLIETRTARTYASRGRGRPARLFAITDAGRSAFEHTYDDLASSALRFLAQEAGPAAVEKFARHQVSELERRYGAVLADAAPADRVRALADALSADGYAASAYAAPAAGEAAPAWPSGRCGPCGRGRAAVPAPLPGGARGRGVPAALRGGDRGIRPAAGPACAATGYDRPRRRNLHHARHRPRAGGRPGPVWAPPSPPAPGRGTHNDGSGPSPAR